MNLKMFFPVLFFYSSVLAQIPGMEAKNWYFGFGTDGLQFNFSNTAPIKLNNKMLGVGGEGMIVVNHPVTGNLLFYSDGLNVIDATHSVMFNGNGLLGHESGAQCVQCLPIPNVADKYYLLTNSSWDNSSGTLHYSIIDFTDLNYPDGKVTNKNTLIGPSVNTYQQANKLIAGPCGDSYWWIVHKAGTAQYDVYHIDSNGFSVPITYTFTYSDAKSYGMAYSPIMGKLAVSNVFVSGGIGLTTFDFNNTTGVLSNEFRITSHASSLGDFSPDGSKLYFGKDFDKKLYQYDFNTGVLTNMNTCCFSHDVKAAPNGKMYHIHTYNSSSPLAVINNPNLSAISNACGYQTLPTYVFNGEVRRFPEFVTLGCSTQVNPLPLPIEFMNFSANLFESQVKLTWEIPNSLEDGYFEVEKSNINSDFVLINKQNKEINKIRYEYDDNDLFEGKWFYRIKSTDINGVNRYTETKEVFISFTQSNENVKIFPNPCGDILNISITNYDKSKNFYEFSIVDELGRILCITSEIVLPLSHLQTGIYYLKVNVNGNIKYELFSKE